MFSLYQTKLSITWKALSVQLLFCPDVRGERDESKTRIPYEFFWETNISKRVTNYVLELYKIEFSYGLLLYNQDITTCPIFLTGLLYSKNATLHSTHLHYGKTQCKL